MDKREGMKTESRICEIEYTQKHPKHQTVAQGWWLAVFRHELGKMSAKLFRRLSKSDVLRTARRTLDQAIGSASSSFTVP